MGRANDTASTAPIEATSRPRVPTETQVCQPAAARPYPRGSVPIIPAPDDQRTAQGLLAELSLLYEQRERETRVALDRSLPLIESVSDRWERAAAQGWGEGTSIYHLSYVFGDVEVGEHTWIGPYTLLDGSGRLKIGSWCSISSGVQIYTHNTVNWAVSGGGAKYEHSPTTIGDRCFIGPLSVVAMGVTIGPGCVIGAHSFVNRDVPEGSIAVGVPARLVGRVLVDDDEVQLVYD